MDWVNSQTARMEERYGSPRVERIRSEASPAGMALMKRAKALGREHDITLFILRETQIAVIRKPGYPPDVFRAPSGGVEPDESLEEGAGREAFEETGLRVALRRYLLRAEIVFVGEGNETLEWTTHVFLAEWQDGEPRPVDIKEVAEARWASLPEFETTLQTRLETASTAGLRFRAWLQERALSALREWETRDRRQ